MTGNEEAALLKGTPKDEPHSALERITLLEHRVLLLEDALRRAFGDRWMDERVKAQDEPTSEL